MTRTHYADDRWERRNWLCGGVWGCRLGEHATPNGCFFSASQRQIFRNIRYTSRTEDRSRLENIAPERSPSLRLTRRRREIQSECSCDGGTLGFPGGWSELSKPTCENSGCQWRADEDDDDPTHQPRPSRRTGRPFPPRKVPPAPRVSHVRLQTIDDRFLCKNVFFRP